MKTIEAIISLMVLLSFASLSLIHPPQELSELTKYQLAEDVWRIAYLKGCFEQDTPEFPSIDSAEFLSALDGKKGTPDPGTLLLLQDTIKSVALSDPTNDMEEYCLNPLFEEIHQETGLLVDFSDTFEASAGSNRPGSGATVLHKVVILNGVPQEVTLAVE